MDIPREKNATEDEDSQCGAQWVWTALDAKRLGFETYVVEDATRAIDLNGSREAARADMRKAGVTLA